MKLENLRRALSKFNIVIIQINSNTVVCTSPLFARLAMASNDTQGLSTGTKTDSTTLTTTFMKMFIQHQ